MSRDKDVKLTELKTGAGGLGLGAASLALDAIAQPGGAFTPFIETVATPGMVAGGVLAAGAVTHNRWYFSAHQIFRREVHGDGWLDKHDLNQTCGKAALRKEADQLRPGLKGKKGKPTEYGWNLGEIVSGHRNVRGRSVYSPGPRPIGIVGPTESGKSQLLIGGIIETPGAAVITSTKPELAVATKLIRQHRGPVAVFNPQGLGADSADATERGLVENTFYFDPVLGCTDQQLADARAWGLVRGGGGREGIERADFWAGKAVEIIRCYLMAAALQGWDMGAVMHWAHNPDDYTPVNILEAHPAHVPAGWIGTLTTHLQASHNTRTGYFATVTSCVGFMDNPLVAAACRPPKGHSFNVAEFLRSNGTLYLIGGQQDLRVAPLLNCLTEYLFSEAQKIAAGMGGRLDPYLTFWLDEVANITPVPLDQWTTDSRGWGIRVVAVIQALSQLETTWGPARADTIWANLRTKIILPGVTDQRDLEALAYLAGKRWVERVTENENSGDATGRGRSRSTGRSRVQEPVVEGHTISGMPKWHIYVHGLGRHHAAVLKFEPGYKRATRETKRLSKLAQSAGVPALQPAEATEGVRA
ncbi:TraM recognition domain-containing protein [Amycolatopsis sp. K13G38]|uniref:TraM recognition domain-containing protein n=1 Tax=Amycolatopsis acididurans TaxID=2724524 RepID=A0ABX1JHF5_9PSEU|nr:type IV secretory system conjugative DNA transfer family protein [Amycolatopsis acididurans]NKQ59222.1 TraM recognition domain-containing protein [Amycolatopsis acididurans]